jgi:hypothetical protein
MSHKTVRFFLLIYSERGQDYFATAIVCDSTLTILLEYRSTDFLIGIVRFVLHFLVMLFYFRWFKQMIHGSRVRYVYCSLLYILCEYSQVCDAFRSSTKSCLAARICDTTAFFVTKPLTTTKIIFDKL